MTPTQKLQQIKNWIFSWSSQHSFTRMTDDKGNQFEVDGELSLGKELYAITDEGMIEPAKDGEYQIEGKVLNVMKGLIAGVVIGNRVITEKQINEETKKETMAENVLNFEPEISLFVENDNPILFYEAIVKYAKSNLSENGFLFFEIHPDFSAEISDLLKLKGFINIELRKDLQGKNRMIKAQNP